MTELTGEGGKGSVTRPSKVPRRVADLKWDLAFGNEEEKAEARRELIEMGIIKESVVGD